jgi:hypothetical protein
MKNLLGLTLMLIVTVMAIPTFSPVAVNAVGTPTENYTIPDLPTNDPSHEEIKPLVNYYLKGTTSQAKTSPAAFATSFTSHLEQNKYTVVGDGQWYMDVDINTPGWLYIYEYYPPNNTPSGRWLAYKWQLKQSGVWSIGPFTARSNEPEGQHVYRLWFYGNGQWAATNSDIPQTSLIYWAYLKKFPELKILSFTASSREVKPGESVTLSWNVKGAQSLEISKIGPVTGDSGTQTVDMDKTTDFVLIATGLDGRQVSSDTVTVTVSAQVAPTTTPSTPITVSPPVKTVSFLDQVLNPLTLISILSVIVIIVLGLLLRSVYLKRWASPSTASIPTAVEEVQADEILPQEIPELAVEPPVSNRAKLTLHDGLEIRIACGGQVIGRAELARALGLDELGLISRKQFRVTCQDGKYFIEDAGSANSTKLNSEDIKGKGTIALKDGDIIDAAGVIKLTFFVSEA